MGTTRRTMLAGLAGLGVTASAWAQVIGPQSDPWAQVDPYDDPRNGFPRDKRDGGGYEGGRPEPPANTGNDVFRSAPIRQVTEEEEAEEVATAEHFYLANMEKDGGPVADPRVQRAMQAFIEPLVAVVDRPHLPWEARVAKSGSINAWTLGGGKMSFNAGLIAACDHPGELMAVVAHEMGHVDRLHGLMRQELMRTLEQANAQGMLGLGKMPAGDLVPGAKGDVSVLDLLHSGFRRENEYEADEHSIELMRRAGMDPSWAVSLMRKLERQDLEYGHHLVSELLQGHPLASERAANLESKTRFNPRPSAKIEAAGWDVLKAAFPTPAKWRNI